MEPTGLLRVLVAVTLAGCVYGNYFIACPNTFRPETDFSCEISYTIAETVSVEVKLGIEEGAMLDSRTENLVNGRRLITLRIPKSVPTGTYTLTVIGRAPDNSELFRNSTIIQDESDNSLLLIQTDKPIYKPLQTVKFRIVCVDQDLKPRDEPTDISIFDQNDNKLEEWLAVTGEYGVIENSYQLSDLPPLGKWRIQAKNSIAMTSKEFSVDKYVLPKFEVTAMSEPDFLITEGGANNVFIVKVKAKYTYGKNVVGRATFIFGERRAITETAILQYDAEGYHKQQFSLSQFETVKSWNSLKFSVNVTETATLATQSSNQVTIKLHDRPIKMEFLPTSSQVFRSGQEINLQLRVTDIVENTPARVSSPVEISAYIGRTNVKQSVVVDQQGMAFATFQIPATEKNEYGITFSANLKMSDYTLYQSHRVLPYRTKLDTTVTVSVPTAQPIAGSSFDIVVRVTAPVVRLAFMVLARGVVVDSGLIQLSGLTKTHTINTQRWMAPKAHVVVYGLVTDGKTYEVIADFVDVQVNGVFDNEVSLEFSTDKSRAGKLVDVTVRSAPSSKYFILAVDKSVLLLGDGNDLSKADVKKQIEEFGLGKTLSYNDGPEPHMKADFIMPGPGGSTNDAPTSAGQIFTQRGLVYMTGMIVEDYKAPEMVFDDRIMMNMVPQAMPGAAESAVDSPAESGPKTQYAEVGRVRKSFPEAWMWKEGMVNPDGSLTFTETVPDTITEWIATAFTVSGSKGLAITEEPAKLTSFQPFFASMTLPYAIRRGEIFQLRVTVNNYIEPAQNTAVKVTLKASEEYGVYKRVNGKDMVVSEDVVEEIEVQSQIPGLVIYNISAKKLGPIKLEVVAQPDQSTGEKGDSLMRYVLVNPEGIVQREVEGTTVELDDENTAFTRNISITFPDEVVPDSKRIEVKVTGDIMGPTVDGLERLVQMPTGCGEQNMITLVPNIVVYQYLKTVNRLTTDIENKAIRFMKAGYERELQYKRSDGSFSAFGESDSEGSTWLTAFVMKCFSQAKNVITVDPNMMKKAFEFVKGSQNADGTFDLIGKVIHQEMLGKSTEGKRAATAFIFIALKESESFLSVADRSVMNKALTYLENLADDADLKNSYELAIVAYALALADNPKADMLLDKLEKKEKPWERPKTDEPVPAEGNGRMAMLYYPPKATSNDVETWSYVLMAYAKRINIVLGRPIMKWLLSQQNGQGGFFSTQDTVLGLQALAEYAAVVYEAPQTDITLTMRSNRESHVFYVQKEQLLLLQSYVFTFPDDTTFVELTATGKGLALVKTMWQYNTKTDLQNEGDKKIKTKIVPKRINDDLYTLEVCFKYTDPDPGMMLMSIQKQTEMSLANREQLENELIIKRVDDDANGVHLYFDGATKDYQCANVNMQRDAEVMNMKAASIKTFPYYKPEIFDETLYSVTEATQTVDICAICMGNACPENCDKCKNCGRNCPAECDTSGAKTWKYDGMLLAMTICFLLSLIMAM